MMRRAYAIVLPLLLLGPLACDDETASTPVSMTDAGADAHTDASVDAGPVTFELPVVIETGREVVLLVRLETSDGRVTLTANRTFTLAVGDEYPTTYRVDITGLFATLSGTCGTLLGSLEITALEPTPPLRARQIDSTGVVIEGIAEGDSDVRVHGRLGRGLRPSKRHVGAAHLDSRHRPPGRAARVRSGRGGVAVSG
jgi:hypothetical protein